MLSNERRNIVSTYSRNNIANNHNNHNLNFNTKNDLPQNINTGNNPTNIPVPKPKLLKLVIILISVGSVLVATAIVVPIVVLSNKDDDEKINNSNVTVTEHTEDIISIINTYLSDTQRNEEIEEITSTNAVHETHKSEETEEKSSTNNAETVSTNMQTTETDKKTETESPNHELYIEELEQTKYCIYSTLKLKCANLDYYPDIAPSDISFEFPIEGSAQTYICDSINNNIMEIKIPQEAISGKVVLSIEKLSFNHEFSLEITKEIKIKFKENIKFQFGPDMTITNENITRCKNNYSIVYSFISEARGIYDVELSSSIAVKDPIYLYADIDYDLTAAIRKGRNIGELVKKSSSTRFTDFQKTIHGSFYLEENKEYFVKIAFLKNIGMHIYNINGIRIIPNENQNKKHIKWDLLYIN